MPLEEVKEDVTLKTREQKKGEILLARFEKAGPGPMEKIAANMDAPVVAQDNFRFDDSHVNGLGNDPIAAGVVMGTHAGKISKTVVTHNGVCRIAVDKVTPAPPMTNAGELRKEIADMVSGRSDYELFNALKEAADIEFHRSRID
jgi:peptidyl-prolyl cis-trans isomerase D